MPPMDGVAGRMIVTYFAPGGPLNGFSNWQQMGKLVSESDPNGLSMRPRRSRRRSPT